MGSNFELAFGEYLLATVEGNGPPYVGSPAPPSLVWKDLLQSELPLRVENRRTKKVISARCTEAPRQEAPLESQHWARCAYFSEPVRSGEATEPSSGSRHIQVATMELSKEGRGRFQAGERILELKPVLWPSRREGRPNAHDAVGFSVWHEGRPVGAVQSWSGGPIWLPNLNEDSPTRDDVALIAAGFLVIYGRIHGSLGLLGAPIPGVLADASGDRPANRPDWPRFATTLGALVPLAPVRPLVSGVAGRARS